MICDLQPRTGCDEGLGEAEYPFAELAGHGAQATGDRFRIFFGSSSRKKEEAKENKTDCGYVLSASGKPPSKEILIPTFSKAGGKSREPCRQGAKPISGLACC